MTTETRVNPAEAGAATELAGLAGEFTSVDAVIQAARTVRAAGYTVWDVHSPFPIHGIDPVIGIRPTMLPWLVLGGGLAGLAGGLALQVLTNAIDYPFFASGKPLVSMPTNIPVAFETTILCAALTAVFGMLLLNRLPHLSSPLFKLARFRRVTNDRFFIVIDAADPRFDAESSSRLLQDAGAVAVERIED